MRRILLILAFLFVAGCASVPSDFTGEKKPTIGKFGKGTREIENPAQLEEMAYYPLDAAGKCLVDSAENSITSVQEGIKMTMKFLDSQQKKKFLHTEGIFSPNVFVVTSVKIENNSNSKIKLDFSKAVLIAERRQLEVLSHEDALILAVESTGKYAKRAARPYMRAGLSPQYAQRQVAQQNLRTIQRDTGIREYMWIQEEPILRIFPKVRISKSLFWNNVELHKIFKGKGKIKVIIPEVAVSFYPDGRPSKVIDFWFEFKREPK